MAITSPGAMPDAARDPAPPPLGQQGPATFLADRHGVVRDLRGSDSAIGIFGRRVSARTQDRSGCDGALALRSPGADAPDGCRSAHRCRGDRLHGDAARALAGRTRRGGDQSQAGRCSPIDKRARPSHAVTRNRLGRSLFRTSGRFSDTLSRRGRLGRTETLSDQQLRVRHNGIDGSAPRIPPLCGPVQ